MTDIANMPAGVEMDAMPAGPELDVLVAAAVGDSHAKIPWGCAPYSTHDGMALAALKLWHEKHPSTNWGLSYCIESDPPYGCAIYPKPWRDYSGYAPTLALAICRAIVTAAEAKGD